MFEFYMDNYMDNYLAWYVVWILFVFLLFIFTAAHLIYYLSSS